MQDDNISENEINAFLDNELDEVNRRGVADRIAADPALADRVARLKADKDRLVRVYGPLIDQPVPQTLLDRATVRPAASPWWRSNYAAAMAGALAIVLAAWLGYWISISADPLLAEALAIRNGTIPAESLVSAPSLAAPEARDRIVADSIAVPVKVPDLRKAGFDLTAIAVYPDKPHRHSVQLRYRNGLGRIFTVYLAHRQRPQGFELIARDKLRFCVWQTEDLTAVMVGEMPTDEMLRLASLTYADLNF